MKHHWISATPESAPHSSKRLHERCRRSRKLGRTPRPSRGRCSRSSTLILPARLSTTRGRRLTPQERIAFLVANPALHAELKARWSGANAWQRQWYVKNYPGIESLAAARHWAESRPSSGPSSWRRTRRSRTGSGSVAEDAARVARRHGEEMAGLAIEGLSSEARETPSPFCGKDPARRDDGL